MKGASVAQQVKSKERVADHGEVFTNEREVNAMLDMVKQETERIDSRFLEPACGDGNFLAEILRRKLAIVKQRYSKSMSEYEKYCFVAVASIYGVELLQDNATDCRSRLFDIVKGEYMKVCKKKPNPKFGLDEGVDFKGTDIASFTLLGSKYQVNSWKEAADQILGQVCELDPAKMRSLANLSDFPGTYLDIEREGDHGWNKIAP